MNPTVHVGKSGFTDGLAGRLDEALNEHELIKMRFVENKEKKKEITESLAERATCEVVGIIGNVAILFREHADETQRKIYPTKDSKPASVRGQASSSYAEALNRGKHEDRKRGGGKQRRFSGKGSQLRQKKI